MNLNKLLFIHAIITLAADIVLIIMPTAIPATVDMPLRKEQYLLCYFLAAGELAISYLSFVGARLKDPAMLRIIVTTMVVFHGATIALELLAFAQGGVGPKIMGNIVLRLVIIALFSYYGFYKLSRPAENFSGEK